MGRRYVHSTLMICPFKSGKNIPKFDLEKGFLNEEAEENDHYLSFPDGNRFVYLKDGTNVRSVIAEILVLPLVTREDVERYKENIYIPHYECPKDCWAMSDTKRRKELQEIRKRINSFFSSKRALQFKKELEGLPLDEFNSLFDKYQEIDLEAISPAEILIYQHYLKYRLSYNLRRNSCATAVTKSLCSLYDTDPNISNHIFQLKNMPPEKVSPQLLIRIFREIFPKDSTIYLIKKKQDEIQIEKTSNFLPIGHRPHIIAASIFTLSILTYILPTYISSNKN
tara:strand:- start:281 stop:1126 length:846 start_codon:yes stop_codon:yes gene_type:complete